MFDILLKDIIFIVFIGISVAMPFEELLDEIANEF